MDRGRFVLPATNWDSDSALPNYNAPRDAELRFGGAYGGRGFPEGKFPRQSGFPREPFHRDIILEREGFPVPPPAVGLWPAPTRRRSYEEELGIIRAPSHRHEEFVDNYREIDAYRDIGYHRDSDNYREIKNYGDLDSYRDIDKYRETDGFDDRPSRYVPQSRKGYVGNGHEYDELDCRPHARSHSREGSHDVEPEFSKHSDHDSEYEHRRHDRSSRRHRHRERERERRGRSRERERSSDRERRRERSRSYSHDEWDRRSYSPRRRGSSYDEDIHERRWDRDGRRHHDRATVTPSATLVVKGLSQKTVEDDLYQALNEWGPLRHVRVIKERSSGISRGFAFIDFPSVDSAKATMEALGDEGLVLDGRRLSFEYSSKPTGGSHQAVGLPGVNGAGSAAVDWICTICGCVNFARRTSCFQCNECRAEDAPPADAPIAAGNSSGRKGSESGPTHVLVVRGLDDHVNEEMLHYEFSKYAPIKDLRLVRDRFTRASRGFAFVHFHSVEEATKALEASNGVALEKNGQLLRVAYAKNIHGPCSTSGNPSSLAAAAIEAAAFSQQYDAGGWASKESGAKTEGGESKALNAAPQSGFVWDEASGYYYDASSGFYYDGHRGLYYDGNQGVWYTYNSETQQYVPFVESGSVAETAAETLKNVVQPNKAPESAGLPNDDNDEKKPTLAEAVEAAAIAAQVAAKKDKEKMKAKEREIRLASKGALLAHKKRINSAVNLWKQRQQEGHANIETFSTAATVASRDEKQGSNTAVSTGMMMMLSPMHTNTKKVGVQAASKDGPSQTAVVSDEKTCGENPLSPQTNPRLSSSGVNIDTGANRETTRESGRYDMPATGSAARHISTEAKLTATPATPFKTDASALGSYVPVAGAKRRFTEAPQQPTYRDRAAERRSLYGSSSSYDDTSMDLDTKDKGAMLRSRGLEMPFPPGVGPKGSSVAGSALAGPDAEAFEVITADKAIDEKNVGNRMLRNMGWQEGLGLGKDGSGIVEPVQARSTEERAGLGSQVQHRKVDPRFESQPGDSYRVVLQKKALQRFHEMV